MKILFATTNANKVNRLINFLNNFLNNKDITILTLNDLGYKISEPDELGTTPREIAASKASHYWSNLREKMPVLTQDDTIQFFGVEELSSPKLSIKKPVIDRYGEFSDDYALKYYTELASQYCQKIEMRFNYGFALASQNKVLSESAKLNYTLVSKVSEVVVPGYFLTAIIMTDLDGKDIYYSELNDDQQALADKDLSRAVKKLILELN